jgi:hypothetical protein
MNPSEHMKELFIIGNYMISPKNKEVLISSKGGEVKGSSYTYHRDSTIDYDHTTLLAVGNRIYFKEHFPFKFDVNNLKIVQSVAPEDLFRDDSSIYYFGSVKIDIAGYNAVNDYVYKSKNNGKLFFFDVELLKLKEVGLDVDESSLNRIVDNYYYDKRGLYFFGGHFKKNAKGYYDDYNEKSEKLVSAQNIIPLIAQKYFSFNGEVFAKSFGHKIIKLNIDADKAIEVNMNSEDSFLTDGQTVYSSPYDEDNRNQEGYFGVWYPTLYSGGNLQKIYSPLLHFLKEGNSVVFNKNDPNNFPGLIAVIDNQNYLLADKKKIKIDQMLFYHPETGSLENFDEKYLKIYKAERFIQYKNVLYFDGIPVETSMLDMENLREIKNSNYLTDGKSLLYIGNIGGYSSTNKNGVEYAVFSERILENVYNKELTPVNPNLLSDGQILVSYAKKIRIKDLGLEVKIVK